MPVIFALKSFKKIPIMLKVIHLLMLFIIFDAHLQCRCASVHFAVQMHSQISIITITRVVYTSIRTA